MCPLCSSTLATPLKIITTARRSVHTLMGSNELFRTKTLPFILSLILRDGPRECQNNVAFAARNPKSCCCATQLVGQLLARIPSWHPQPVTLRHNLIPSTQS